MRLLLIEDDLKIASFVSKGLKEAGFVVEHASDGNTGDIDVRSTLREGSTFSVVLSQSR